MVPVSRRLAAFAAGLAAGEVPPAVRERAGWLCLDLVGIAVRARAEAPSVPSLLATVAALGLDRGEASVLGDRARYGPAGAALVNGALAHALDFDDTHARASVHASAPVVPAALAAAEMSGASGRDLVTGIVAGYEVLIRLSLALVPADHYARGFHPTATCGAFGAAAAVGRILGLDADAVEQAFGICASRAAGSLGFLAGGAWTKHLQVGRAAMNGLEAACLAGNGFRGPAAAIEGERGFLSVYAPDPVPERAVAGLGSEWETLAVAVKPYPACRYAHAAIDAVLDLRAEHRLDPRDVRSVEVGLSRTGWSIVGDPEPAKQRPRSLVDGQFSMPFLAALALRTGDVGWDDLERHLADGETLDLCRRVCTVVDDRADAAFPANMAGVARVETAGGRLEKFVEVPRGEPGNFVTAAGLRGKFDALAGLVLGADRRDELARRLLALDGESDVAALLRLTRPVAEISRRSAL